MSKLVRKRRWLVNYMFQGGIGRVFMTTDDVPLTEDLVLNMDQWLIDNAGVDKPVVTNPIMLEVIYVEP